MSCFVKLTHKGMHREKWGGSICLKLNFSIKYKHAPSSLSLSEWLAFNEW